MSVVLFCEPARPESMFYRQDTTVSSLERLGEAGWLPDVRSEESLPGQACNQPGAISASFSYALLLHRNGHVIEVGYI